MKISFVINIRWLIRQALCGAAGGIGLAGVMSYVFNYRILRVWVPGTIEMSLPTGIALVFISAAHFVFPSIEIIKRVFILSEHLKKKGDIETD